MWFALLLGNTEAAKGDLGWLGAELPMLNCPSGELDEEEFPHCYWIAINRRL
jgi:hypothetical protein